MADNFPNPLELNWLLLEKLAAFNVPAPSPAGVARLLNTRIPRGILRGAHPTFLKNNVMGPMKARADSFRAIKPAPALSPGGGDGTGVSWSMSAAKAANTPPEEFRGMVKNLRTPLPKPIQKPVVKTVDEEVSKATGSRPIAKVAAPAAALAASHFKSDSKDWKSFEANLGKKAFQKAVTKHPEADEKLKKYVKEYGAYVTSRNVVKKVPSLTSPSASYEVKKLPSGRLGCGCKDWQFKHSINGTDCKHIKALKTMEKVSSEEAFIGPLFGDPFALIKRYKKGKAALKESYPKYPGR